MSESGSHCGGRQETPRPEGKRHLPPCGQERDIAHLAAATASLASDTRTRCASRSALGLLRWALGLGPAPRCRLKPSSTSSSAIGGRWSAAACSSSSSFSFLKSLMCDGQAMRYLVGYSLHRPSTAQGRW